ncbi:MAG: hypothetical protein FWB88_07220 [Defluviitaleaceae bacterium]|nr:hypothetical protein [Defluviitaleaceae bacterium]MCL2239360.1 hypothetical protein [Defluviitaleaceae bacterium]
MLIPKKMKRTITAEEAKAIIERAKTEEPLELEKGDLPAMILAAFIVFLPFLLVFIGSLGLVFWLFFSLLGG